MSVNFSSLISHYFSHVQGSNELRDENGQKSCGSLSSYSSNQATTSSFSLQYFDDGMGESTDINERISKESFKDLSYLSDNYKHYFDNSWKSKDVKATHIKTSSMQIFDSIMCRKLKAFDVPEEIIRETSSHLCKVYKDQIQNLTKDGAKTLALYVCAVLFYFLRDNQINPNISWYEQFIMALQGRYQKTAQGKVWEGPSLGDLLQLGLKKGELATRDHKEWFASSLFTHCGIRTDQREYFANIAWGDTYGFRLGTREEAHALKMEPIPDLPQERDEIDQAWKDAKEQDLRQRREGAINQQIKELKRRQLGLEQQVTPLVEERQLRMAYLAQEIAQLEFINKYPSIQEFYTTILSQLHGLFIGLFPLASNSVERTKNLGGDQVLRNVSIAADFIAFVPIVATPVSIVVKRISEFIQTRLNKEQLIRLREAAKIVLDPDTGKGVARTIAIRLCELYEYQLKILTEEGADKLGCVACAKLLDYLNAGQLTSDVPLHEQFIMALQERERGLVDQTKKRQLSRKFLDFFGINTEELPTHRSTGKHFYKNELFSECGIRTEEGDYYISEASKYHVYGFRVGSREEAEKLGMTQLEIGGISKEMQWKPKFPKAVLTREDFSIEENRHFIFVHSLRQAGNTTNIATLPSDFVKRTPYLEELSQRFLQKKSPLVKAILWGPPGRGKSSIALDFANQNIEKFSFVWQIDCERETQMIQSYQGLAEAVGIRYQENDHLNMLQRIVHNRLNLEEKNNGKPYLLIFDNAEEAPILPKRGQGRILITSRQKKDSWGEKDCIEIKPLAPDEAINLLTGIIDPKKGSRKVLSVLCQELGCLPAAITQIGRYIGTTPGIEPGRFLEMLQIQTKKALGLAIPDEGYSISLIASWKIIQDSLEQSNPQALRWLQCCAYLSSNAIPINWLNKWKWLKKENPYERRIKRGEILRVLTNKGLISYNYNCRQETISVHRLRQHLCRIFLSQVNKEEIFDETLQLLHNIAENFDFNTLPSRSAIAIWSSHVEALLSQDLAPCIKKADLLYWLGQCKEAISQYEEGLRCHRSALDIRRNLLEKDHLDIVVSLSNISDCLFNLGKCQDGMKACREAVERRSESANNDHLEIARSHTSFGLCLMGLGRYEKAMKKFKEALKIVKRALGNEHILVATGWNNIGFCLLGLKRYEEAIKKLKVTFAILEKIPVNEHLMMATSLTNNGNCLLGLRRYEEALEKHQEALDIWGKALGDEHPSVAIGLNNIGNCLVRLVRYQEALTNYKQSFIIACCHFKQEHPFIVLYLKNVVGCLKEIDKENINKATKEELFPFCREYLGENHECTRFLSSVKASTCIIQ